MRLFLKILSLPLLLVTGILYVFCKFLVLASGTVLSILSGIVLLIAIALAERAAATTGGDLRGLGNRPQQAFAGGTRSVPPAKYANLYKFALLADFFTPRFNRKMYGKMLSTRTLLLCAW